MSKLEDAIVEQYTKQNEASWNATLNLIEQTFYQEDENKVFPVELFKQHFLPFFVGEKDFNEHPEARVRWLQISDGPTNSVKLINDKKEVVAIVPPLVDTKLIDVTKVEAGRVWKDIIYDYHTNISILPAMGINGFINDIVPKIEKLDENLVDNSSWFKLFSYFNIQPNKLSSDSTSTTDDVFLDEFS
jgi:hypothetical protein